MDWLSSVVSKINSPRFHIDRRLSLRGEWWLGGVRHCRNELTASQQPKYSREGRLMAIMTAFPFCQAVRCFVRPGRCVVTTASTSITQYLESEEVALSVVRVHRAPLPY